MAVCQRADERELLCSARSEHTAACVCARDTARRAEQATACEPLPYVEELMCDERESYCAAHAQSTRRREHAARRVEQATACEPWPYVEEMTRERAAVQCTLRRHTAECVCA
jgi:hypothetical protein